MSFLFDESVYCCFEITRGNREPRLALSDYLALVIQDMTVDGDRGTTLLHGRVVDQAALLGLINTLYDLNYIILSMECMVEKQPQHAAPNSH